MPKQGLFGPKPLSGQIDQFNGVTSFQLFANNPDANIKTIDFNIVDFKGVGKYLIRKDLTIIACYFNSAAPNQERAESGEFIITKYDGRIISGTFQCTLKHRSENISISDGRFDIKLN